MGCDDLATHDFKILKMHKNINFEHLHVLYISYLSNIYIYS